MCRAECAMVIGRILPRSCLVLGLLYFSRAIPERDAVGIRCTTQPAAQESTRRKGLDARTQEDGQHSRPPRKGSHSLPLAARPLVSGISIFGLALLPLRFLAPFRPRQCGDSYIAGKSSGSQVEDAVQGSPPRWRGWCHRLHRSLPPHDHQGRQVRHLG
jgi:hypothetical protein